MLGKPILVEQTLKFYPELTNAVFAGVVALAMEHVTVMAMWKTAAEHAVDQPF